MEKEIALRQNEVFLLRDQLKAVNRELGVSPTLTAQLATSERKARELNLELEKFRKECAMAQGKCTCSNLFYYVEYILRFPPCARLKLIFAGEILLLVEFC